MFPDIDVSGLMDQFAGVADYIDLIKTDLPGLYSMFNESLPEEVLKIATDLDMTGAQARWNEFASNPGAITTEAIITGYETAETAAQQQVLVTGFIDKYTEIPEGASTAELTPEGVIAYVAAYALLLRDVVNGTYYAFRIFHAGMATPIPVANGGTGANNAKAALNSLGIFYAATLPSTGTDGQICLVPA